MARRELNVFSLSFLDVMACGLGATILFLMIISAQVRIRSEAANAELAQLVASVVWAAAPQGRSASDGPAAASIPPRRYSDDQVASIANSPSSVLCECPRHLAELLIQISSFDEATLRRVASLDPRLPTAYLAFDLSADPGLLERAAQAGDVAVNPWDPFVDEAFMERCRSLGLGVNPWTVAWVTWLTHAAELSEQTRWVMDRHLSRLRALAADVKAAEERLVFALPHELKQRRQALAVDTSAE